MTLDRAQRGATLLVCLALVAALTVLSVTTMKIAALGTAMAANLAYERATAAAARSGISLGLQSAPFSIERRIDFTVASGDAGEFAADITVGHVATTEPPAGFSMGRNASAFAAHHFEIDAFASGPRSARAHQRQGFYIIGPRLAEL